MDHELALETKLPMRYVLGDLPPADRNEFEEHMADCSACMNEVWMATTFASNAKEVFRAEAAAPDPKRKLAWFQWRPFPAFAFSAALNVVLVGGLAYGVLRVYPGLRAGIADLNQPAAIQVIPVRAAERAASAAIQTVKTSEKSIVLSFDLPKRYEQYVYSIAEPGGRIIMSREITYTGTDSLNLQVPTGQLAPGEYKITLAGISGNQREELGICLLKVDRK